MKTLERLMHGHGFLWLTFFSSPFWRHGAHCSSCRCRWPRRRTGATPAWRLFLQLCTGLAAETGYASAMLMWSLMALAMMAPTAFPAFRTYSDLTRTNAASALSLAVLVAGYMTVWLGFSALAALLQIRLSALELLWPLGRSASPALSGALLVLAGLYQFSSLKAACLSACQSPMAFFIGHWRPGTAGALRLGLRLGAVCLGCCWALMLLAFVGGTMNLTFMGLAMVLMTLEKAAADRQQDQRAAWGFSFYWQARS
ncbi:DUF2182 domain-containing protein [Roseibium salinum]|nr:DUF2182 domain-containing protein [Roseibium salinum]